MTPLEKMRDYISASGSVVRLETVLSAEGYPNEESQLAVDCEYNRRLGKLKEQQVTNDLKDRLQKIKKRRLEKEQIEPLAR